MNDLLEKALVGCGVAYRAAHSRILVTVGVLGFALGVVVMVAGARVATARASVPLTTWLGLQDSYDVRPGSVLPGTILLLATAALLLVWALTVRVIRRRGSSARSVWGVVAAWAAPFAFGPPLFDTSIYRYAAFALLQRADRDPYTTPPSGLGFAQVTEAVEPGGRGVPSSAGPLGTLGQHVLAAVGDGNALAIVIALRVVAVVSVIWIGRVAVEFAAPRTAAGSALALTALNPLLLFFVVSAGRLEGPVAALALSAVAFASRRAWTRALVFASIAASVLAPAFVVVLAIVAAHLHARRARPVWRTLVRDVPVVVVIVGLAGLLVPHGFGWVSAAREQFATHTPFSVADATGAVLSPIVRDASYDTLTFSARAATVIAAAVVVIALLVSAGSRPVARTAGYGLLAVGLLGPNLYPWFLIAGLVCVAPRADAVRTVWVVGLSAAACLLAPGGFGERGTDVVIAVSLAATAVATAAALRVTLPRGRSVSVSAR